MANFPTSLDAPASTQAGTDGAVVATSATKLVYGTAASGGSNAGYGVGMRWPADTTQTAAGRKEIPRGN